MKLKIFDNRHIGNEVKNIEKGDTIVLIDRLSRKRWSKYFKYTNINEANLEVKYITQKEFLNMPGTKDNKKFPFSAVTANPPYSEGSKLLYRYFFEKSLELAENVTMIMPVNLESTHDSRKQLNYLIKKHSSHISEDISHNFNVGQDNIRCVIASKNINNAVDTTIHNTLNNYTLLYPQRKRLQPIKGNTQLSNAKYDDLNGEEIVDKILRTGVFKRKVLSSEVKKASQKIKTPYVVFVNHTPSKGLLNIHIEENFKTTWSMRVFAFEVDKKEEVEKLCNWLKSKEIQDEILKMFKLKNDAYTVTKEMLGKLPWYE
jgi:hypothetical protein